MKTRVICLPCLQENENVPLLSLTIGKPETVDEEKLQKSLDFQEALPSIILRLLRRQ